MRFARGKSLITRVAFSRGEAARAAPSRVRITITITYTGYTCGNMYAIYLQGSRDIRREVEKIWQRRIFWEFYVLASQHIHCFAYLKQKQTKMSLTGLSACFFFLKIKTLCYGRIK